MFEYIIWLFVFFWIPLSVLWIKYHKILKNCKKTFILVIIGSIIVFGVWDNLAVKDGVWFFNEDKILNIWILGLPIEEWFFTLFAPLFFSTITIIFEKKLRRGK